VLHSLTPRLPFLVEKHLNTTLSVLLSIFKALQPSTTNLRATQRFRESLPPLVSMVITRIYITQHQAKEALNSQGFIDIIRLCLLVDPSLCDILFLRLLDPPSGIDVPVHVSKILLLFVSALKKAGIDLTTPPFSVFCSGVFQNFIKVTGPAPPHGAWTIPPSELDRLKCKDNCPQCRRLRSFLCGNWKEECFQEVQKIRSHLEDQAKSLEIGLTWETSSEERPYTLVVRFASGPFQTSIL
jgi:hypothetical protein